MLSEERPELVLSFALPMDMVPKRAQRCALYTVIRDANLRVLVHLLRLVVPFASHASLQFP